MHSVMVIAGGLALLAAFLFLGRLLGASARGAASAFVPTWLICSAANMYIGVTQAGYTIAQELPIFAVIFLVPTAVALVVRYMAR